jgi:hypothetical protein
MIDLSDKTYPELLELKKNLIAEGLSLFDDFRMVLLEYGTPVRLRNGHIAFRTETPSFIAITYVREAGYIVAKQRFSETLVVLVTTGKVIEPGQLRSETLYHIEVGDQTNADNFIHVPGKWVNVLLDRLPEAKKLFFEREDIKKEALRQKLLTRLFSGRENI